MRLRRTTALIASVAAAAGAGGLITTFGSASSHREAPLSALDPTADDTDVYAFTADDAPNTLTVVSDWIPFEDPAGGPNFYRFDDKAKYYVNVDNTGDGKPELVCSTGGQFGYAEIPKDDPTKPWTFQPRPVVIGSEQDGKTVIRSGLKTGATVVSRQGVLLQ